MAHFVKRGWLSVVDASKDNPTTIRKKEKAFNTANLDAPLQKWLLENGDKTSDIKLVQRNEETPQPLQSRRDAEASERTIEEFYNSTLRKLLSQIELVCERLNLLEKRIQMVGEKSGTIVTRYRKNRRVMYIPKTGIYEEVLKHLREHDNEELKITMEKVFYKAAQQLGLLDGR